MRFSLWRWTGVSISLLIVDRLLKYYVTHSLPPAGVFWIPGWFELVQFHNSGIAFSLPMNRLVILCATIAVLVWITVVVIRKNNSTAARGALILLLFGAGSNFFDRLVYGAVIDYMRIGPWSLVNLADGMILAALATLFLQTTQHTRTTTIKKDDGEPPL